MKKIYSLLYILSGLLYVGFVSLIIKDARQLPTYFITIDPLLHEKTAHAIANIFKTYGHVNTIQILRALEYYQGLCNTCTIRYLPDNTINCTFLAHKPQCRVNDHLVLTKTGDSIESSRFISKTFFNEQHLEKIPQIHCASVMCRASFLQKVVPWYLMHGASTHTVMVASPHEVLLQPHNNQILIRCAIERLPSKDQLELVGTYVATYGKRQKKLHAMAKKTILVDLCFSDRVIVRTIQGECSWQTYFNQNQLPQLT